MPLSSVRAAAKRPIAFRGIIADDLLRLGQIVAGDVCQLENDGGMPLLTLNSCRRRL